MKALIASFASGLVFALGLGISGMTRPVKVIGFLDFFGAWDATLALVMLSAITVYFIAYRWSKGLRSPWLAPDFALPKRKDLDVKLILGSALFGVGWGLGGFCPGPALASLASGAFPVFVFVAAMGAGMFLHSWVSGLGATTSDWAIVSPRSAEGA
jgi:uncharacterized membrane protein YedE/YeeE